MKRSESIKKLLQLKTHPDLAGLYHDGMEVQVNVSRSGGDRVDGEFRGREWHAWTDGFNQWKSFRIPLNANSDPVDTDTEMTFDLAKYTESIGMTGWDWKAKRSIWVGFDFDSIAGHSEKHQKKLDAAELQMIRDNVAEIPWVTLRASTGGSGLHLYVFIDQSPEVNNHTEHAALARSVLGKLSALTGFDFSSRVDVCGGNLWVMHTKTGEYTQSMPGLRLIKQGIPLLDVPVNWRDHLNAINRGVGSKRSVPKFVEDAGESADDFESVFAKLNRVPLDEEHKALFRYLDEIRALWWWDPQRWMCVCHTSDLKGAHSRLGMRGMFDTLSLGTEHGQDQNCFAYPARSGGWIIRRHTRGVAEADTWEQDGQGWTKCTLNMIPDLKTAARIYGGIEHKSGGFMFTEASMAAKAASLLGAVIEIPSKIGNNTAQLKEGKDGKLIFEIDNKAGMSVDQMKGWWADKSKLTRLYNVRQPSQDQGLTETYDDLTRHLITESGGDYGWVINVDGNWHAEPMQHVSVFLQNQGVTSQDVKKVLGGAVARCWKMVNQPFQPEYPGDRKWNRDAAQLRFAPSKDKDQLHYPTWFKILSHVGRSLDQVVLEDKWCKDHNVLTGADYLKLWISALFQKPYCQLPYLFFYGDQDCGKSMLHEAVGLLMTKGYVNANTAIQSVQQFNGELQTAILCYIEEVNLSKNPLALSRIKEWVTCLYMSIHGKHRDPFGIPNMTHWMQFANGPDHCPIFKGDTRIVVVKVGSIPKENKIPKPEMLGLLEKEASDFLAELLRIDLPDAPGRLLLPVLATDEKRAIESSNQSDLEAFVTEKGHVIPGETESFMDFYNRFCDHTGSPNPHPDWSKVAVGKALRLIKGIVKGKIKKYQSQTYVGNFTFNKPDECLPDQKPWVYCPNNDDDIIQL